MSETKRPKKCLLLHRWRDAGWDGLATLIDECVKCHWQRAFNGFLNAMFLLPPGTYRLRPRDGSGR